MNRQFCLWLGNPLLAFSFPGTETMSFYLIGYFDPASNDFFRSHNPIDNEVDVTIQP